MLFEYLSYICFIGDQLYERTVPSFSVLNDHDVASPIIIFPVMSRQPRQLLLTYFVFYLFYFFSFSLDTYFFSPLIHSHFIPFFIIILF